MRLDVRSIRLWYERSPGDDFNTHGLHPDATGIRECTFAGERAVARLTNSQSRANVSPQVAAGLQAAGQLSPTHELGCLSLDQIKPIYTGADLYHAIRECLDKDEFDPAAQLFALAGAYGRFDIQRITDKTVSGGLTILMMDVGDGVT